MNNEKLQAVLPVLPDKSKPDDVERFKNDCAWFVEKNYHALETAMKPAPVENSEHQSRAVVDMDAIEEDIYLKVRNPDGNLMTPSEVKGAGIGIKFALKYLCENGILNGLTGPVENSGPVDDKAGMGRKLITRDGDACWLYPDGSHRGISQADCDLINADLVQPSSEGVKEL